MTLTPLVVPFTHRILLTLLAAGALAASVPLASSAAPLPLGDAVQKTTLHFQITGNGRDQLRLSITNSSPDSAQITVPAGLIFKGDNGERVVILRTAGISVAAQGTTDADLPAAALSSRNSAGTRPFSATADSEPKLSGLLKFLASHDDLPRATSQLLILAILEDITFGKWQQFLAVEHAPDKNAGREVVQAIDALGLLREIAPGENFALTRDNELKLRALRNPVTRAKAVQLYGITLPDEPGVAPAGAPNLKQLLHTQPGDNCPVCRMREQAGRGAGDF